MVNEVTEVPKLTEQTHMVGQRASVRYFDPRDKEDIRRLLGIIRDSQVQKWVDGVEGMNKGDVVRWSRQRGKDEQEECLFAVSGSSDFVGDNEVGEVQAFVNTYLVGEELRGRMVGEGVVPENRNVVEVSYARNPRTKPGQVASGLVQVCFLLNEMMGHDREEVVPSLPIVAFVDEQNVGSIGVLERAGFVQAGEILYDQGDAKKNLVYRLDWERAQFILHEEADRKLSK